MILKEKNNSNYCIEHQEMDSNQNNSMIYAMASLQLCLLYNLKIHLLYLVDIPIFLGSQETKYIKMLNMSKVKKIHLYLAIN